MKHLLPCIAQWKPIRAVVVGDFMLDHYVFGNAERLSPDAPVPVLHVEDEKHHAGGAGNVCAMLRALRAEVRCVGVVGEDADAGELIGVLADLGCDTDGLIRCDDRPTTVKRSFIGLAQHRHPQKMFRTDYESKQPLPDATRRVILEKINTAIADADVICIEDYGKSMIDRAMVLAIVEAAKARDIPVLVDPAAITDFSRYIGVTAITPNRTEAEHATGLDTRDGDEVLPAMARKLHDDLQLDAVILTLDRHGAALLDKTHGFEIIPTEARTVYDVTGAGDMVLAMLATAIAQQIDWPDAVRLANIAGGLEVEQFGVCPITIEQIHLKLLQTTSRAAGKRRTLETLLPEIEARRSQGQTVAFTNGCFDILHAGHLALLEKAGTLADMLIVAVNSDASIAALKGPTRPIVTLDDRLQLLAALSCIDYVVVFGDGQGGDGDTPLKLISAIKPDVLIKGGDYATDQVVGHDIVEQAGGRVEIIPLVEGLSTSNIIERIRHST